VNLVIHIPDDIAARPGIGGADLVRRALEAFAIEAGRLLD
jgi:hypothetical protein